MFIDTVLLKVASRCNLDCSYCYVYNMGDEAWRTLPKRMSLATEDAVARSLGELLRSQGREFSVVLHGGEPLMLGERRLASLFSKLRTNLGLGCGISIQTNGVLITPEILDCCAEHHVTLSVSIDGPAEVHDQFRIDRRGQASHAAVEEGIRVLQAHGAGADLFSGVLAVVDPKTSPETIYHYFKYLCVPSVDFLYRDGNHSALPFGKSSVSSTEYGTWMSRILDCYVADAAPFRIRMLDDMLKLALGGVGVKEGVGLTDYGILIIDTDGSIKKNDTLKSSPLGDAFNETWNIHHDELQEIAVSQAFRDYHVAQRPTSSLCTNCSLLKICGGGMLTHRFREGTGYDNPTVFCADQTRLISRIYDHIAHYLSMESA
ncbi:cyclophane-forming radical SAM/SPASM peptide maturase YhhB [Novacetimonas pomaceti]|uniref:Radical SAM core domain-containing protein n=1 Tax=Novacetimonas pomaceti TaxID=2021998 RepID=A0A318QBV6_9PROT|nr:cyclophane-forming radical SAM/SPASM peptide maturase YhhB [Novacetimonas pomaceti]PYD74848.1 hypothetical protein CFR71_12405 [Novacetimonas pomaceti]